MIDERRSAANQLFASGDIDGALKAYSAILDEHPNAAAESRALLLSNRAQCHLKRRRYAEAAADARAAIELLPTHRKTHARLLSALDALHESAAAARAAEHAERVLSDADVAALRTALERAWSAHASTHYKPLCAKASVNSDELRLAVRRISPTRGKGLVCSYVRDGERLLG